MSTRTTLAICVSVFFVTLLGGVWIDAWKDVRTMEVEAADRCNQQGYTIERMDLIPYGACLCNEAQHCFCYPI